MRAGVIVRRVLAALLGCAVAGVLVALALAACVDAGMFRGAVIRFMSARAGRPIEVAGALRVHLLSAQPEIRAEGVTIGNPPWVAAGEMARIGELVLVMDTPVLHRGFGIQSLSIKAATLHLARDAAGRANWQWRNPDLPAGTKKLPILRSLSIPGAEVLLEDERRHLKFAGTVSADGGGSGSRLAIKGDGKLNGHPDAFEITGDPLDAAHHATPYHFSFVEHSSGSELEGHGELPEPFDFTQIEASFEARGESLKDLYFLTGVTLVDSGAYRLSGRIVRTGDVTRFVALEATTGQSDIHGSLTARSPAARSPEARSPDPRSRLEIDLESRYLKLADFGRRAAGRAPVDKAPPLFLSDAAFKPSTLRRGDAAIRFRASELQIGRVVLKDLAAQGTLEKGVLSVPSLTAGILSGKLRSHGRVDARTDEPKVQVDIDISGMQLGEIPRKSSSPPPATGLVHVRAALAGVGRSVHQVASTANGTLVADVGQGTVRDSFAEMTGVDLKGLGLIVTKNQKETPLRCAVAEFDDRDGTLTARRLFADSDPVLITGQGRIHLDTEALDLAITGHPKSVRLFRFHAAILIKGTLSHPSVDVQARQFALVDPGKAKDADCATAGSPSLR